MLDFPLLSTLLPEPIKQQLAWVQESEAQQWLTALGYLAPGQTPGSEAALQAAALFRVELRQFRREAPQAHAVLMAALPLYLPALQPEAPLTADELCLLKRLASLEGELELPLQAALQAEGLAARVLRYRLGLFGLGEADESAGLRQLAQWTGSELSEALRLSGDLCALVQRLLAHNAQSAPVDGFQGLLYLHGEDDDQRALERKSSQDFIETLENDLPAAQWTDFQTQVLARVGQRKTADAFAAYLAGVQADPLHGLLLRLFRLQLWIDGLLDSLPSEQADAATWEAISQLFRFRLGKKAAAAAPERDRLLAHVHDGLHALNLRYFFRSVCGAGLPGPAGDSLTEIQALYAAEDADALRLRAAVETHLEDFATRRRSAAPPAQGYPGEQGVQRLFEWVRRQVDGLGEALERLFDFLRGGLNGLYASLLRGFDTLGRGLSALLDPQPIVTAFPGCRIRTEVGPDFHMVTQIEGQAQAEALLAHQWAVEDYTKAVSAVGRIAGQIIAWGVALASSPMSWVQLGLKIAAMIDAAARGGAGENRADVV